MGVERCKKSAKVRGGIEWGSAIVRAAANRARKLRIESGLKSKARCADLRIRKSTRAKTSARRFTDRMSGTAGGAECKFGEKIDLQISRASHLKFNEQILKPLSQNFATKFYALPRSI